MNILLGARTASDHFDTEKYSECAQLYHTTEDGTLGEKGLVTDHSLFLSCPPLPGFMPAVPDHDESHRP